MKLIRHRLFSLAAVASTALLPAFTACATQEEPEPQLDPTEEPTSSAPLASDVATPGPGAGAAVPGPIEVLQPPMPKSLPRSGHGDLGIESQCGPTWDAQPIEQYNGNAGIPTLFTAFHESRVGYHSGGCSGTLISDDLFLSAGHCNYAVNDVVYFNYQNAPDGMPRTAQGFVVSQVVEQELNANRDYAIVRLAGSPGREFGHANLAAVDPPAGTTLTIIGHPAGRPKEIHAGLAVGTPSTIGSNWFVHWVDTEPGSSGSGVLDPEGRLVGIHTDGGCQGYPFNGNNALRISQLIVHSPTLTSLTRNKVLWRYNTTSLVSLWTVSALGAFVTASTFDPGAGWSPLTYSNNRLIWRNTDGRISYWRLNDANTPQSYVEAGPYFGWRAVSAANDRVLWRNPTTNNIWLNSVDANGTLLSSVHHTIPPGWTPVNYANNHILWRHSSGLTSLWRVDEAGNYVSSAGFDPGAGWIPVWYENGQLLWRHTDGRISMWNLTRDNVHLSQAVSAAVPGWTALLFSDRKIAWRHTSGQFSLWNINSYGNFLSDYAHNVGLDWTPIAIAGARP
jgi:Trypsin-like peptidase domain